MTKADILVMGATGKVGRLLRAHWRGTGMETAWQGRSAALAPGWVRWEAGMPIPPTRILCLLSGVTAGDTTALDENRKIGLEVAKAAIAADVDCILLASTMAVYGLTPREGASEDTPAETPRPYGLAKLAMEKAMAGHLHGTSTALCALRLGNVAGADMLGSVVATGRRVVLDRFADGHGPVRSYVGPGHLARVVEGLAHRVLRGGALPAVLNVAGQQPVAMADILRAAMLPFDWQDAGRDAVQHVSMDCTRLASLIPANPPQESAAGLAQEWLEAARA